VKWWNQIKELRRNRWLPFYLPIIGTLIYISIVLILIPTDVEEKDTGGSIETEAAPSPSASGVARPGAARRVRPNPNPVGSGAAPGH